jgi:predicted phage tail protein
VLDMTSGTTVPGRPRILTAAVVDGVLTMTWEPPTPQGDVTGYVLEAGTHPTVMNLGSTRLGPATTFTYRMVFGGNYFLRIRAVNAGGIGPASAEVMIRSGAYMAPPPAPAGLTATVTGSTVTFAWTEPTPLPGEAATRFRIEAGSAPGNTGVSVFVPALPTSATFANVPPGRYYVRVRGEGPRGPGAASNEVLVVVP